MGYPERPDTWGNAREVAGRQHGVIARAQLLGLGAHPQAIKHRVAREQLHAVRRAVYSFADELTLHGHWMGAVLSCGQGAVLSDMSAAVLWELIAKPRAMPPSLPVYEPPAPLHVTVPDERGAARRDLVLHRRRTLGRGQVTRRHGIPVTTPIATLVDLAASVEPERLERAVNEADKRNLVDPETMRVGLEGFPRRPGLAALKAILGSQTFALTDSELERRFLRLVKRAGLPMPQTQARVKASASTSIGRTSASWSRPMASPTTARLRSRPGTGSATKCTPRRA
jgi:hypothetical protein